MRIICHRNLFVIRQYSIRQPHQSVAAKTQEKSLITPVKSCMSKLMEIFPGGNKEKGTKMRRLVNFCGRIFSMSVDRRATQSARHQVESHGAQWLVADEECL